MPPEDVSRKAGIAWSLFNFVALPMLAYCGYLFLIASDRYVTSVGLTVQTQASGAFEVPISGFASQSNPDAALVKAFLSSHDLVGRIAQKHDLYHMLSPPKFDPIYAQNPKNLEDLSRRWNRLIRPVYDSRSGLVELQIQSFQPEDSFLLANLIVEETQKMLFRLSEELHDDATRIAGDQLRTAEDEMKRIGRLLVDINKGHGSRAPVAEFSVAKQALEFKLALAQERYALARNALEAATVEAQKKERYLAVYSRPVLAESATYPQKGQSLVQMFVVLVLLWLVFTLFTTGLRDRG